MDTVTEDFGHSEADAEMRVLTPEDITEPNLDASDDVENLRNSLREAVHNDDVRPKMQCLMMDSCFSMVTMQGEDSGIAWETTPSRCNTPWGSEAGNSTADLSSPVVLRSAKPGSVPAGKIIFVMDEELISRRKKSKERVTSQRRQREVLVESSENISGRPELVGFSEPNVKPEREGDEEDPTEPLVDKEQRLFSLVSEGSEILNIVVPPKLATVDEEESKEMVDNLFYLVESPVPKASEETNDNELWISTIAPTLSVVAADEQIKHVMDPPGAPVARPPGRGATGNVDYFEAFALIDAQAPGSPAVIAQEQVEPEAENTARSQDTENLVQPTDATTTTTVDNDRSDTVSLEEINSELLDEVFYGGTDNYAMKSLDTEVKGEVREGAPLRLPSKPSGSTLFGSQEDILTPIFLPEGPPKIIDPILLEEPKAMAFLYTDLYEEAIGSRQKEEDTESMTSEKSFHSRHSDREARGYLEKYVLIDETPTVDVEARDKEKGQEQGLRTLPQDLYDFDSLSKPEKGEVPNSEEEITDFFRSSANSSPCDVEPFPRSPEEDKTQSATKSKKSKTKKSVSIKVEKVPETPVDPLSISSFEFPSEELDWGSTDDHPTILEKKDISVHSDQILWEQDSEMQKPVAPPRRKATSSSKVCLDLTPLTPVDFITQEKEEAGGKEQREEEKETASPAETADEGDGEETMQSSSKVSEDALAAKEAESPQTENVKESNEITARDTKPAEAEETDAKTVEEEERSETATKQSESEDVNIKSSESAETEVNPEKQGDSPAPLPTEPAKDKVQCIIL
ncbi:cardiomyopathy-associated protein 5-like [Seriola lalandi dorsalis]|uniref:cardiomyopathy-associated protein 5-like n=1 Tax=Seriola lalandi dorsalis TaxID=1841481 RepID=UPI000C6F5946|nr:cardiomyopathy-associated protein 5-like [Seriola lalandi dorsalis]